MWIARYRNDPVVHWDLCWHGPTFLRVSENNCWRGYEERAEATGEREGGQERISDVISRVSRLEGQR